MGTHVGDFSKRPPPPVQLDKVKALIFEAIRRHKLLANYNVYGLRRLPESRRDGDAEFFDKLAKWPQWRALVTVF